MKERNVFVVPNTVLDFCPECNDVICINMKTIILIYSLMIWLQLVTYLNANNPENFVLCCIFKNK